MSSRFAKLIAKNNTFGHPVISHDPELSSEFAKFDAKNDTLGPPVISVIVFWHLSAKPGPEN